MSTTTLLSPLTGNSTIDPTHSRVGFVARHAMVTKVPGSFNAFAGIKGVTKAVTVDFDYTGTAVDPYGNQRVGFEGQTTVNRKDWGVNWNAALDAGVLVGEKVVLEFDVSAIRTPETA